MKTLITMSLAVLLWSLYPLAAAQGLKSMSPFEMILLVQFVAAFGAILFAFILLWKNKALKHFTILQRNVGFNGYMTAIVSGASGALSHGLFIVALTFAHKGGVSLLYESWPIIAVMITPFLISKDWKNPDLKDYLLSFLALGGIGIIILSDQSIGIPQEGLSTYLENIDFMTLIGYILALAAGYLTAILVTTRGTYAMYFSDLGHNFSAVMISEAFVRTISAFIMLIIMVLLEEHVNIQSIHWESVAFIGIGVFVIGGALYTYGLIESQSPTIHIIYYFVPVLAVLWLHFAEESPLTWGIILGGSVVLISNVILLLKNNNVHQAE